jgi:hypothetical protein
MASTTTKRRRRSPGRAGFTRGLSLLAFLPVASRVPTYARLVTSLVLDDRMPRNRKALLAGAAGYLVLGRDLIPDDTPIIGGLDDLVVVADHLVLVPEFLDHADLRPFVTLDELRARTTEYSGRGARRARAALAHVRVGSESRQETKLRLAIVAAGLPEPELNVVLYNAAGKRLGRADKVYRRWKVIVEYDGQQHRTDSRQYDRDVTRTEEFIRDGWFPVKIRKQQMAFGAADAVRCVERALRDKGWRP